MMLLGFFGTPCPDNGVSVHHVVVFQEGFRGCALKLRKAYAK